MTTPPIAPRLLKGAIIGMDIFNPLASVAVFQYNPDTITRRLTPRLAPSGANGARSDQPRFIGPPAETITVQIEVDAADQELGGAASGLGVHAPVAALEMLIYPKSAFVIANWGAMQAGVVSFVAPAAPLTVFVWGPTRVVPVRVIDMTITEEAHDNLLNPVRAKIDLSMQVLSYHDLPPTHAGSVLFMIHQVAKEILATSNTAWSVARAGDSLKIF
jgi:hypothetical protein